MLTLLYNGFADLYGAMVPQRPSLANEHARRQEQEIYERTTKSTYPNVIFSVLF
jgi:RNA exonuclease 1